MRRLLTEKHLLKKIAPEALDDYLAKAWYRLGATIYTAQFLFLEKNLYSPIWIRLPLKDYQFRKRLRKIWRKNTANFTIKIQPFQLTPEKETLFAKYRETFKGYLSPKIKTYLFDNETSAPFHTMETCIYDGDKLIGFSFFDVGKNSIASIMGVYDPDYQKLSVGIFTLLLEIDYAQRNNFEFYYPGYVVPGYFRFDYKLVIGKPEEVEYYNIKNLEWETYTGFDEKNLPVQQLYRKFGGICHSLRELGITSEVLFYPAYDPEIVKYFKLDKIDSPLFVSCFSDYFIQPQIMLFYDFVEENFYLYQNTKKPLTEMNWENSAHPDTQKGMLMDFLAHRSLIIKSKSALEVVLTIKALDRELKRVVFPKFWEGFPV